MNNKRNVALAMVGTMVAGTGVQAFAAVTEVENNFVVDASNKDAVVSKVGALFGEKYTAILEEGEVVTTDACVYEISVNDEVVINQTDLRNKLNSALEGKTLATVKVKDKGHVKSENGTVNYTVDTYTLSTLAAVKSDETLASLIDGEVVEENGKLVLPLLSGQEIEISVGDDVLDFTKGYNEAGELTDVAEEIIYFDVVRSEIEEVETTVQVTTTEIKEISADTLFDGVFLTEDGEALFDFMSTTEDYDIEVSELHTPVETEDGEEETAYTGLQLVIKRAATRSAVLEEGQEMILTVAGEEEQLTAIKGILVDGEKTPTKIAGDDRFATAVELSKAYRQDGTASTESVVIASGYSLVDGLAAGPLAAQLNTSILLTNANNLPEVTMEEVKAVLDIENTTVGELENKTVYLIGGEAVIGAEVEAQLKSIGVTVERVAGDNRHETSLAIADKLVELKGEDETTTEAFVVGANGMADAMSISAQAAKAKNPIIVTNFGHTVNLDAVDFVEGLDLTIIGGESAVSNELEAKLDEVNGENTIERLAGADRFETNAEVINKYYATADAVFVAADGYGEGKSDKLVDALASAPLAAKKNAPIVLASSDVRESQKEVLELMTVADSNEVYQIGGGIVNTVIAKVVDLLK